MTTALSRNVLIFDSRDGVQHQIWISEFCSSCGHRRGELQISDDDSGHTSHWWDNPCGHQDTPASIIAEADCQCRRAECTVLVSEQFYPYCKTQCAADDAEDMSGNLLSVAAILGNFLTDLIGIVSVVEACPPSSRTQSIRGSVSNSIAAVEEAQRHIVTASRDILNGSRAGKRGARHV